MSEKLIKQQLHKIDLLAQNKQKELNKEQYDKYYPIFKTAFAILKKLQVLLYGGMAINEMLPKKLKIYGEDALPDIDVFCKNAEKVATKIVKHFIKSGYPVTSYGDALHEGTFKIYVHGLQIIDITNVSDASFKILSKNSAKTSTGIKIVNPQFIRLSLHMMLSQSNDAHRWPKVFQRLLLFYKIYPPKKCNFATLDKPQNIPNFIIEEIYDYVKKTDFVVFGYNELKTFFENKNIPFNNQPLIQLLVKEDIYEIATDIIETIDDEKLTLSKVYDQDDFIPKHIFIYYGKTRIVAIYTASSCVSFIKYNGLNYASIHTIIRMYMLMIFSSYKHFKSDQDNLECLVNMLAIIQYKHISTKSKIFKEFIMDCYGIHKGLVTLKREKLIRYNK